MWGIYWERPNYIKIVLVITERILGITRILLIILGIVKMVEDYKDCMLWAIMGIVITCNNIMGIGDNIVSDHHCILIGTIRIDNGDWNGQILRIILGPPWGFINDLDS